MTAYPNPRASDALERMSAGPMRTGPGPVPPRRLPLRWAAREPSFRRWMEWALLTGVAAVCATTFDAALLERKIGLFGGGYLADSYLYGPIEKAAFVIVSLLADAAILGLLVGPALWIASRLRLNSAGRTFLTLSLTLLPVVVANFIAYELFHYLGDLLNASVLFDLSGRSPAEVIAIVMPGLARPLLLVAAAAGIILALGWALNRWIPAPFGPELHEPRGHRLVLRLMVALLAIALVTVSFARLAHPAMDAGLTRKPSGQVFGHLVEGISDVDGDGFGLFSRVADPDPWNGAIAPYALDVPGNGIDEDGVGGDLPGTTPPYTEGPATRGEWRRTPPIVFVILETFRAEVLGLTAGGVPVAPTLDALAARGAATRLAFSHNGFTIQSRYHLFTGSLAEVRGKTSLVDDFKANGYEVAVFSAQDESFGGEMDVGMHRADVMYDARQDVNRRFSQFTSPGSLAVPYSVLLERLTAYLQERDSSKPLFLHLNFQDAHFPYYHPGIEPLLNDTVLARGELEASRTDELRAMYLNTVANVDRALGQALQAIREHLGQEPAVIVTSDHGESLFEDHALGHGYALNDHQTRIPVIAAGLPIRLVEPMGQSDLRDAIWAALESPDDGPPSVVRDPSKQVFQYVGSLDVPRQIALRGAHGRVTYSFVDRRARFDEGPWRRVDSLAPDEQRQLLRVVHTWERMRLARAGVRSR